MIGYFVKSTIDTPTYAKTHIEIYDNRNVLINYFIVKADETAGYCHCLEDFGYEDRGWYD